MSEGLDGTDGEGSRAATLEATERWFIERGVPHFIEDYRAADDILSRAQPALVVVFFVSTLFVFREEWTGWWQALAVVATFVGLVAVWALVNVLRGRRPLALPTRVTGIELGLILVLPPGVALLVGQHAVGAAVLFAVQAVLLGLVYLGASYAVLPILRWAGGQVVRQIGDVMRVLTRALPILLLFTTFLFVNAEVWQVADALEGLHLAGTLLLFAGVATVFVTVWLDDELDHVDGQVDDATIRELCAGTPMAEAVEASGSRVEPLSKKQRVNLLLVLVVSQLLQAVMVGVAVFGFFLVFGWLAIDPDVRLAWVDAESEWATVGTMVRVSALLAMFSALYFAVYAVTDATYRAQFFLPIRRQMDRAIAVRAAYLAARDHPATPT